MLSIIWKAQILSNLLQLQCVAVAYIVVIIDLGTIAPPHIKLKNPDMITKPKILHMVLIWSLKHRHPPSRDFICFRWWENLVNRKCDSQCFQLFLFPWRWSGPKLRGHQSLPLQMWILQRGLWSRWCELPLLLFQLPKKDPLIPAVIETQQPSAELMCRQGQLRQFYIRTAAKFTHSLGGWSYDCVWKMPHLTAQILSHYKSCYFVVLKRPPFPYCCYSSCILLSWYERQCHSGLSWLLLTQSLYREASKQQSMKLIIYCRLLYQSQTGLDIFKYYNWFSKLTKEFFKSDSTNL